MQSQLSVFQFENDIYQGPLEHLLKLVREDKLDIFAVSLAQLADNFNEFLARLGQVNLDLMGEYVVVAALLIQYKAAALLPSETIYDQEEEPLDEEQLQRQRIRNYERFQQLADKLRVAEQERRHVYTRAKLPPGHSSGEVEFYEVSPSDLCIAFEKVMKDIGHVPILTSTIEFTIDEKMAEIEMYLLQHGECCLNLYLQQLGSRMEIIVSFLALLELLRTARVRFRQVKDYGDIWLYRMENAPLQAYGLDDNPAGGGEDADQRPSSASEQGTMTTSAGPAENDVHGEHEDEHTS